MPPGEQSLRLPVRPRQSLELLPGYIGAHVPCLAREAQNRTGLAIRNLVRQLRALRSATISINGAVQTIPPAINDHQQALLDALNP